MRLLVVSLFAGVMALAMAGDLRSQGPHLASAAYPGMDEVYPTHHADHYDGYHGQYDCGCSSCGDCGGDSCGGCGCCDGGCGCDCCGCGGRGEYNVISGCCESCNGCCGGGCCNSCCCDTCCCNPCCCCCCPWIRVRGESLGLHRTVTEDDFNYGGFTTEQLDFNHVWGVRAAVEFRVCCTDSIELSYFGLHDWDTHLTVFDPNNTLTVPFVNQGLAQAFTGAGRQTVSYTSELHNGEINYWTPLHLPLKLVRGAFLCGARYVSLEEEFQLQSLGGGANPANNGVLTTETSNHLILGQLGLTANAPVCKCLCLRIEGKAAAGVNIAEQRTSILQLGANPTDFNEEVHDSDSAFVADGGAVLTYRICCCRASLYAGYYVMWADGLALAVDQFNENFPAANPNLRAPFVDHNGTLFFQGPVAGFDATW